jgi:hypothetical protein
MDIIKVGIKEIGYEVVWTGFKWLKIGPSRGLF